VTEGYRGKQKSSFNVSVPTPPRLKLKLWRHPRNLTCLAKPLSTLLRSHRSTSRNFRMIRLSLDF
jgi:hypothetical protein